MLLNYDYLQSMTLLLSYMIIYNTTSFLLFSTLMQVVNTDLNTLLSLSNLGPSTLVTKVLSLSILSLAGVPPLAGFFSKVFVLVLLSNSNISVLFPSFFTLLFIGLYFYIQNLSFLNGTAGTKSVQVHESTLRLNFMYLTTTLPSSFVVLFGFCYADDLFILSTWFLI